MTAWNTDIKSAPHGRYEIKQRREGVDVRVFVPERVILATKCGKVTISHYQPEVKRWEMLADGEMPVAWAPYAPGQKLPEHPNSNDPVAATDTTGDYLRKPPAVVSGQIILVGDAPRETDCQAGEASQGGKDASRQDTVSSEAA